MQHGGRVSRTVLEQRSDARLAIAAQAGDTAAREALILRHRALIPRVARAFRWAGFADEDLHQAGTIGLIVAVDRFQPERGVRFATYACALIRGELQHMLRDQGWAVRMPRSLQDLGRAAARERDRLTQEGGAPASIADVSASLGEDGERVAEALQARDAYRTVDAPQGSDADDEAPDSGVESLPVTDHGFERAEHLLAIKAALPRLPVRQRRIVALRFWGGLTQERIASELGVSQMHVSRLLRMALRTLADAMAQ